MVTIKDVAREAGVSVATVSRVYNGSALVKEDTRQRVQAVAQRLGYSPNGAARSLITSKTNTIGVLLPDLHGEFFSELIRGIDQTAQRHGYHLLVSGSHDQAGEIEAALQSMHGRVDGLIVMSPNIDARDAVRQLSALFPVVLLNCAAEESALDTITIANRAGARAMVRHLIALGHRRIAIITGSEHNYDAVERRRGYHAALREAGIARRAAWEVAGDFGERSGYVAARELLRTTPRPTAIFASNDAMAIGAISALREAGVRVPADIAVAGFDDIPMAAYLNPPLTTVHVDIPALGERASDRLVEALRGKMNKGQREELPTRVVVRDSCGGRTVRGDSRRAKPGRSKSSHHSHRRRKGS
jgi:LacI family transcriptional regulator